MTLSLSIPLIAFWVACITGIPQKFARALQRPFKPFTCAKCMGLWLAFLHEWFFGFNIDSIWYIPLCSLTAWGLQLICNTLKININ